ncbi:MAG: ribonucleoside-diphosphate reductase subunit alpha, partial [Verrucomicrobiota bacterium]
MKGRVDVEEDRALRRQASEPADQKPRFDWRGGLQGAEEFTNSAILVESGDERRNLEPAEVADTVGSAITDLLLARNETEIFTEQNRELVEKVSRSVVGQLVKRGGLDPEGNVVLSETELVQTIESALEKHRAYDVARSFLFQQYNRLSRREGEGVKSPSDLPQPRVRVIRRNGDVVGWNRDKVEIAVRKAFLAMEMDSDAAVGIADALTRKMLETNREYIEIEELQDHVQEELMRQGHFKVAADYVLYRSHRANLREQEEGEAEVVRDNVSQESMILVSREDGTNYLWDGADLRARIRFSLQGLELDLSSEEIETELRRSVFPEMTQEALNTTLLLNAKSLVELDADFSRFAGRILLTYIYEEVLEWDILKDGPAALKNAHQKAFRKNLERAVEIERINPDLLTLDLDRLAEELDPDADLQFELLGIQSLYDRYLIVDKTGKHRRLETPQLFWMRVSMGIFYREEDPFDRISSLYELYRTRRFCSSTPTLFNAGTTHSQLSSCYLYKVDDSLDSIMTRGIAENAQLSKWAGGLGGSWTAVRGTGSYIKGTNGESQGVIPFLKLHNDQLVAVNQGGKRKGSGCAYLESWHCDIFDFLELRKNTGDDRRRTHDMNTANWVPDLFMKRMERREHWTLFRSNEATDLHDLYGREFESRYLEYEEKAKQGEIYGKEIPAIELWKAMLRNLFETGHPWITFKDPCNVRSPQDHVGVIHSSNLCTEITLNTSDDETAVCNLGSVVL